MKRNQHTQYRIISTRTKQLLATFWTDDGKIDDQNLPTGSEICDLLDALLREDVKVEEGDTFFDD